MKKEINGVKMFEKQGWVINPNERIVNAITKRVIACGGECPCHNEGRDRKCPCSDYLEEDNCHCNLYIKQ